MRAYLLCDLDQTLVNTWNLRPLRKSNAGKRYVAEHAQQLSTSVCDPGLVTLLRTYHQASSAAIVTNAPEDYAQALLKKHGFPSDIPIIGSAEKPHLEKIRLRIHRIARERLLMIGDGGVDVLAAHGLGITSIGVTWGRTQAAEQVQQAEATRIVSNVGDLEQAIIDVEHQKLSYRPRTMPQEYSCQTPSTIPPVEIHALDAYYPYKREGFNEHSRRILSFKGMKEYTLDEVRSGHTDDYWYSSTVQRGALFKKVFVDFMNEMITKITSLNAAASQTLFIPAPNSLPDFCYEMDALQILARNVAHKMGGTYLPRQQLRRVLPKVAAHSGGIRTASEHYTTIGVKDLPANLPRNIIILDDVTTSGTQIRSIAAILQHHGLSGKYTAVCLGKTV